MNPPETATATRSALAAADPAAVVEGPGYRITVLTSQLLRLERQEDNQFADGRTQLVQSRRFPVSDFTVTLDGAGLDLWTDNLHLHYDGGPFTPAGLSITLRRGPGTTWRYGDLVERDGFGANLMGTARTLDDIDGATELEPGLLSRRGYSLIDDSSTLTVEADNWVSPRTEPGTDMYFFGYGIDFDSALRDWFTLTGPNPVLPRWVFGNWWSRFHRYSAEEYLALMDQFRGAGVPFSVAVLDMDWHLVDIDPSLGTGWTGYTWNPDLFPDPKGFLSELGSRGLRATLNVHPADGVRRHEAAYPALAREVGVDPAGGREIAFDITSRTFVDAYFRHLHHPHEEIGVDFWWLDWQQGTATRTPGLDPLWMLNHLHFADSARDGRRPLTFSRYAGLGGHRYPIGFSGDTVTTWASLDFQPYFTATAANVGYHWWSHDIGGHLRGTKDDELATRWFQFGVFSPICRLHSSASRFNTKEPWRFGAEASRVMTKYLRLRHQLVPYLYAAMWDSHVHGTAPVRPMYHAHPDVPEAYEVANQYLFGPQLVVAPLTRPADRATGHAEVTAWLPPGRWYDLFTAGAYDGDRMLVLHRTLDHLPVLARAGAILPLAADPMADVSGQPESLIVKVFLGAEGQYRLVEDDGSATVSRADCLETRFDLDWRPAGDHMADATLTVESPVERSIVVEFVGAASIASGQVVGGDKAGPIAVGDPWLIDLGSVPGGSSVHVTVTGVRLGVVDIHDRIFEMLDRAQIDYDLKDRIMTAVNRQDGTPLLASLQAMELPGNLIGVLTELTCLAGAA